MGVVYQSVKKGVGDGRIPYHLVPVLHGKLARDDGRCRAVPVLDDFEKVSPFWVR